MDAEYPRKLQEEEESLAQAKDAQATDVQPKDAQEKGIQYITRYHGYKKKPQSEYEAQEDAEEEVQVPTHDDVDQENVVEETANDVAQPTSPLPPSPIQVLDKYSALVHRVEGLVSANIAQQLEILKLKARVKKLERLNKSINKTLAQKAAKKRRLREEAKEAGDLKNQLEGKTYDQIRPIFQARFDANMRFLLKSKEEMEKEEKEIIKSINKTPAQKAAKKRRLREEAKEARDLKNQLERINTIRRIRIAWRVYVVRRICIAWGYTVFGGYKLIRRHHVLAQM
nr:hypothetical protein [Tanacetum cinerariifolium]